MAGDEQFETVLGWVLVSSLCCQSRVATKIRPNSWKATVTSWYAIILSYLIHLSTPVHLQVLLEFASLSSKTNWNCACNGNTLGLAEAFLASKIKEGPKHTQEAHQYRVGRSLSSEWVRELPKQASVLIPAPLHFTYWSPSLWETHSTQLSVFVWPPSKLETLSSLSWQRPFRRLHTQVSSIE